jgi:hypothetical protein
MLKSKKAPPASGLEPVRSNPLKVTHKRPCHHGLAAIASALKLVSFSPSVWQPKTLGRPRAREQMRYERNHGEQQQQVDQAAGHMKHQEAAGPHNHHQQRNQKKRPKSHSRLLKHKPTSTVHAIYKTGLGTNP